MATTRIERSFANIYESVRGDRDEFMDEDAFRSKMDELVEGGYLTMSNVDDDYYVYAAQHGMHLHGIERIAEDVKREVLMLLIENPKTAFVLVNTQKGKMRIAALEVKKWSTTAGMKAVAFVIVANDKTLADQSQDGLLKTIGVENTEIHVLSSNTKTSFDMLKRIIDAYEHNDDYKMPLVVALANEAQAKKVAQLMHHIHKKFVEKGSKLRFGTILDEADAIWPRIRRLEHVIDGQPWSLLNLHATTACHRVVFVSATDGELLEGDYPECANAYLYPVSIDPADEIHYRALHHPEAVTHTMPFTSKHTYNSYAMEVIEKNRAHFMDPRVLPSGERCFPKTIVNSNTKTDDMKDMANWCTARGMNVIVFNGIGGTSLKVHREGMQVQPFRLKGKKLNEVLFYVYKKLGLHDKPLVVIGRRKVDRGLGFHYSPRNDDEITIEGTMGPLVTRNREGLIFTDEILGRIEDKSVASQKAGRLAGIIGNSPQYPGTIHFWTDAFTENLIRRHNTIVDETNTFKGCSISQAVDRAEVNLPNAILPAPTKDITKSHLEEFATKEAANTRWKEIHPAATGNIRTPNLRDGEYICSIGGKSSPQTCDAIRAAVGGSSMANWGSGYTDAKNGESIHRIYAGKEADGTLKFFLRWAIVGKAD
jgi:hypothetical protein